MKISECTYCGMTAITDEHDICASCQAFVAPETAPGAQNAAQPETDSFQQSPQGALAPAYNAPNNYVPQTNQNDSPPVFEERPEFPSFPEPPLDANCLKCDAPIPSSMRTCDPACPKKKSSPLKYVVALLIVGVIGFFGVNYAFNQYSPYGTFRKYAKTTGADDSIVYENFMLKGDTVVEVVAPPEITIGGPTKSRDIKEEFSFKMVHKKPDTLSVEMLRGEETVFKQVFDGTSGWRYTNLPGQRAGYQDTEDGFGSKKMGMGLETFNSLEFMSEGGVQEFGEQTIEYFRELKEIEVADLKQPSGAKTFIVGKQKRNGKEESTLLVFDEATGLLLGMVKNGTMGNVAVRTRIYFDKYSKFPVKKSGLFGVGETRILVPTEMKFVTSSGTSMQVGGMPVVTIRMNVKSVETDAAIDDAYFAK